MAKLSLDTLDYRNSELVIALVTPTGTDTTPVIQSLTLRLTSYGYRVEPLKVSDFLLKKKIVGEIDVSSRYQKISSLMTAGDTVRKESGRGDSLALLAIDQIYRNRKKLEKRDANLDESNQTRLPRKRTAYIVDSLKHPDEVQVFRKVYGVGFYLIGVYSSLDSRLHYLRTKDGGMNEDEANDLCARDENEKEPYGQKTRDTYYLSDVFISTENGGHPEDNTNRFIDLLFGDPFVTPTRDEHAMYLAFATATRSSDLSRQVGAIIYSKDDEILALGANEVPCFGGGLYYAGHPYDRRDFRLKYDANEFHKRKILEEISILLNIDLDDLNGRLAESTLFDITEFGRAAHAEMEAIISCARKGVSLKGGTLYSTTFPCHNCAKYIVTSGIGTVVYVEPYPKSKAGQLHEDSIQIEGDLKCGDRVRFKSFVGIGARRFMDFFSLRQSAGRPLKRKDGKGEKVMFSPGKDVELRVPMPPVGYIERESLIPLEVKNILDKIKKKLEETSN
jgi:deoxycytidylate deaminase